MLTLDGIVVRAGGFELRADFSTLPRERIAVIGPSGAGKSTLLDVIAGFRKPDAGRVLWSGGEHGKICELTELLPGQRPLAMLFQDNNLFPHLSIARNLGLALQPSGRALSEADQIKIDGALGRVGLGGLGGRKPGALSGGQQSRAALARVLVQEKPIILLDEPFAALGPALKTEMLDLVAEVAEGLGALVMLVTHDPEDARRFGDRVVLVADGNAAAPVATAELFDAPPEALRDYLGR